MATDGPTKTGLCPICSKSMTDQNVLYTLVKESKIWLAAHPHADGDPPVCDNTKQMLHEGGDFAAVILECLTNGRVVPAYANLRHLIERAYAGLSLAYADNVKWEYQSMARRQQLLDRRLQGSIPEHREGLTGC